MASRRSGLSSSASPGRVGGSPRQTIRVDDTPIVDFVKIIDNTPSGAWQKRVTAFENLMKLIPEGSDYNTPVSWYNNPPTLRHLANPLSELLKDARSTVVKRTCGCLLTLFSRCQTDARYLFKDLMPTVLSVHAQTVQVIRQAVQFMVLEAITEVPCKMVMPLWMERLKIDKSRTVRDACALYLGQALICWTDEGYLTEEIWLQVGKCLISSLRDPSPSVRSNSKAALESMQRIQPDFFEGLINDPEGRAANDVKLSRWLRSLGDGNNPDPEELSIMSRISYNSDIRTSRKVSSGASVGSLNTPRKRTSIDSNVPSSIALGRRASPVNLPPSGSGANGSTKRSTPTTRRSDLFARKDEAEAPPSTPSPQKATDIIGTPTAVASPMGDSISPIATGTSGDGGFSPEHQLDEMLASDVATDQEASNEEALSPTAFPADLGVPALRESLQNSSSERQSTSGVVSPSLNNTNKSDTKPENSNQDHAESSPDAQAFSKRRSRNSVLIQQRLKMSSFSANDHNDEIERLVADEDNDQNGASKPPKFPPQPLAPADANESSAAAALPLSPGAPVPPPEHMVIAIRLLKAHKAHVDAIMETLRIEMDTLRDFDRLLEEPGRPTEDEVLDYFESVGLCLEQRVLSSAKMQEELDRVSRGEPPQE